MSNSDLLYGITDKPKTIKEWALYSIQQCLSVFVATVLISVICGTPASSCLFSACIGTLVYQFITKFRSPMFISSSGATCAAVIGALSTDAGYLAVSIGGLVICAVYTIFATIIKKKGVDALNSILPPMIVGSITIVIGINLASFIPTYTQINGTHSNIGILICVATTIVIAICSHFFKGFWKTIPFLIGLVFGYIVSVLLTIFNVAQVVDLSAFANMTLLQIPDFTFKYWNFGSMSLTLILKVLLMFLPVSLCALCEHYSDHKVMSNIIGTDLTANPGLQKTLVGDGVASLVGTILSGLPNTTYGESIATTGFSKVASTKVITVAAVILGAMSFLNPVQVLISTIPACVFGGCACILYGYIACSGLKTLINSNVNWDDNKSLVIVSVILTVGTSGIFLFHESFAGVSLAMVIGIILNLVLRTKNN